MKSIHHVASILTCVIIASAFVCLAPAPATAQSFGVINQAEPVVLTVQPSYLRHHEAHSEMTASLVTAVGKPLADAELLLRVDDFLELRARTDPHGIATFELPAELLEGGYDLRFSFAGSSSWQPATAMSQLTMLSPQTPGLATINGNGAEPVFQGANIDVDVASTPGSALSASGDLAVAADEPVALTILAPDALPRGSALPIRLTSVEGEAIGEAPVVLFVDHALEIDSTTDAAGEASFHLPPELLDGDYRMRVVFTGKDEYGPSMQMETLSVHPASILDASPQPQDANTLTRLLTAAPAIIAGAPRWLASLESTLPDWVQSSPPPTKLAQPATPGLASGSTPLNTRALSNGALAARRSVASVALSSRIPSESQVEAPGVAAPVIAPEPLAGLAWAPSIASWWGAATGGVSVPAAVLLLAILMIGLVASPVLVGRWRSGASASKPRRAWSTGKSFAIPMQVWYVLRICSVGIALGMAVVLVVRPALGLRVFWGAFIPVVPLLFFLAPGLWRNICPMAALNQTPRLFNFSRNLSLPRWWQEYSFVIAAGLFLVLASSRKVLFNQNGPALALLILAALGTAFLMGSMFKGKSGWCSSICPLLPVQRVYGQTPFVTVPHAHCQPCLGCTKNCYDLSPKYALLADFHDPEPQFAAYRKVFIGLFPGFILGFFVAPNPPDVAAWQTFGVMAFASLVSLGSYFLLESLTKVSDNKISVLYGAIALNIFYWFNAVTLGKLISNPPPDGFVWSLRALVLGLTLIWIERTFRKEATYFELALAPVSLHGTPSQVVAGEKSAPAAANPVVIVEPEGKRITVEKNKTLLEICESHGLPIEAGCRMGLCGADPVCIKHGMENLSKLGAEEKTTLERLGLGPNTRMACMARVRGDVKVALTPDKPDVYRSSIVAGFKYDAEINRVVIVGNGIAGVTAADHIRRRHPKCEIHLIGRERHHLYNRMGITRLIYGRSAMQGLYLLPDQWYEDFNITCWLNTHVAAIDPVTRTVTLGTGETLVYDRLILTTGSQSFLPPIEGYGMPGSFVLRTAEDAMAIRAYVQEQGARRAVVAGGGLLGLEAAYGLLKLGLDVTVLERSNALLTRQLDSRGAEILRHNLEQLGLKILMEAEVAAMESGANAALERVTLADGRELACDLLLVAAGIRPDLELAREIGLSVGQGVLVDEQMRTSDPYVFAAGDVAEYASKVYGLWPVAVSQAEVAANNAVAAVGAPAATYAEAPPVTMLKVVGIDLTSVGRIQVQPEQDIVIALEDDAAQRYRKLIVNGGKIAGAILLGYPEDAPGVIAALKQQVDVAAHMNELRAGDWQFLSQLA